MWFRNFDFNRAIIELLLNQNETLYKPNLILERFQLFESSKVGINDLVNNLLMLGQYRVLSLDTHKLGNTHFKLLITISWWSLLLMDNFSLFVIFSFRFTWCIKTSKAFTWLRQVYFILMNWFNWFIILFGIIKVRQKVVKFVILSQNLFFDFIMLINNRTFKVDLLCLLNQLRVVVYDCAKSCSYLLHYFNVSYDVELLQNVLFSLKIVLVIWI